MCKGVPLANSDSDSVVDDNTTTALYMTNENQADIDENGIGDVCDVFSAQNISISQKGTQVVLEKENGVSDL